MANFRHGMTGTQVHNAWLRMIDRCRNDRQGNYGRRGINVCARWEQSFEAFLMDMGLPPSPAHSLDRIDVNGDYQPDNCRWATRRQQAQNTTRNTVLEHDGLAMTIAEWSDRTGIKSATICVRIYVLGWDVERALTAPVQPRDGRAPWADLGMSRSAWYRAGKPSAISFTAEQRNIDAGAP